MKNSTFKRFLSLVMALSMVLSITVMPAAAEETGEEQSECSHTYENGVCTLCSAAEPHVCSFTTEAAKTDATCGAAGSVTMACSCGETQTQEIPATGDHHYENGVCTGCSQNKPCSLAADCDAPQHVEDCLSQCNGTVGCQNKAHKEGCLSQASCTCVRQCSETMACPVCEGHGECKGGEAAERIATVQALIDALPTQYKLSELEAVQAQYNECTNAIGALKDHERAVLDMTNYYATAEVTDDVNVAEVVGGEKYPTLTEAFAAAAENSGTVKLLTDISIEGTVDGVITIADNKSATLDLNGKTITVTDKATGNFSLFYVLGTFTVKDSVGNGTINLTATNNRGWNSLSAIIHNRGGSTTIMGGTLKHLGGTDMAYAIDNSSNSYGDPTLNIQGGTVRSENYIAIRMRMENPALNGTPGNGINYINVTGGYIYGANRGIWGQMSSSANTKQGELNISGGTIECPRADRGPIDIDNEDHEAKNVIINISGSPTILGNVLFRDNQVTITGGTFSSDVSAYLPIGYTQNTSGTVVAKEVNVQSTGTQVTVSATIPNEDKEVSENAEAINSSVSVPTTDTKVQAAIAKIDGASEATDVKVSLNLDIKTYTKTSSAISITFDVAPFVQAVKTENGSTTNVGTGITLTEVDAPITFRLPMPDESEGKLATVKHIHSNGSSDPDKTYSIQKDASGNCYVELSSKKFSEFIVSISSEDAVAQLKNAGTAYSNLLAANVDAASGEEIILLKDMTLTNVLAVKDNVTLNLNGKTLKGTVTGTMKMNGGTYYTTETYKMVVPTASTGTDKAAYVSADGVFNISATGITVVSGSVSLDQSMGTQEGHILVVNEGATFTVPQNMPLLIRKGSVTIKGTLVNNDKIKLEADATLMTDGDGTLVNNGTIELPEGATLKGVVTGTLKMSGGTYITPDNMKMVAPVGTEGGIYTTNNATFVIAADNSGITIANGSVGLGISSMGTDANHTLTVAEGATFTIANGQHLLIRGSAVVNGELKVEGTGSIELTKTATLKAESGLYVFTSESNHKVVYENGTYKVVKKDFVTVGSTEVFYGTGDNLDTVFAANTAATSFTLSRNEVLNNEHKSFSAQTLTIDFAGKRIAGSGSIIATNTINLNNIGPNAIDVVLGPGDKAVFGTDGSVTVTAAEMKNASGQGVGYGDILLTAQTTSGSSSSIMYFLGKDAILKINANGSISTTGQVITEEATDTNPDFSVNKVHNGTEITNSYVTGSSKTLTFETNAFYNTLTKVTVDDKELASTAYTLDDDDTTITLKNSYLKTLGKDIYKLTLTFKDGQTVSANFYVVSASKPACNPQTGDMIMYSVLVMGAAAAGLAVLFFLNKKKKK